MVLQPPSAEDELKDNECNSEKEVDRMPGVPEQSESPVVEDHRTED